MGRYFAAVDRSAEQLAVVVMRFRWLVVFAALATAVLAGSGGRFLEFTNNYRVFFSDENPQLLAFEELQTVYTKNDNFLFVIVPADGDAFSRDTLAAAEALTEAAWQIPYVLRVDSVTNFQHSHATEDDLIVEDLVRDAASLADEEIAAQRATALAEPLLSGQLLTADARAMAVNVVLQYPEQSLTEVPEAAAVARQIRDRIEAEYPGIDISLTGVSMLNNAFAEVGTSDMATLMPMMFALIIVLTLLVLRSLSATFATVMVIVLSTMTAMGIAGWLGYKLEPISGSAPIVILTLAIADSIHILISLRASMRDGKDREAAIVEALRINFMPVTITSITTIVGFASLNFSDSPPYWHLGNITAMGIAAAWLYSVTLLPALMRILPYSVKPVKSGEGRPHPMDRLANFVIARPRAMLIGFGAFAIGLTAMIPTLDFNDQWIEYFDERQEFRRDSDKALQYFGMYPIEYSVPANGPGGISEPEYLRELARFTDYLRAQPYVTHVYSLSDIMQRLNKNMHGDDPDYYRIPEDRDLAAQYLLLYELSLPYGLDLNDRIKLDKSATRVTVTLTNTTTKDTKAFLNAATTWMEDNLPEYMHTEPTSAQVMFTYITDRNVRNMLVGTAIAIAAIALIMILALRSWRMGLLSLVPNALPILMTFGAWAILVGDVGFSIATVASISLGIIVDDTVHLLSKYVRAHEENGWSVADSLRYAFRNVGVAILVNTVILAAGFLLLMTSSFKMNVDMGLLTALAIVFALLLDFFFLPALLLLGSRAVEQPAHAQGDDMTTNPPTSKPLSASASSVAVALLSGALMLPWSEPVTAETLTEVRGETEAARKGFEIAARSDRSDRGFGDNEVELTMILRNKAGTETRRTLRITTLEVSDESVGDKSLVVFDTPRDVAGTALLSHARILEADDQWLYLPALKRVKRISSANKSGPFVGSEFAFEDFTSLELNKYDYEWLREEPCGEFTCDVVRRVPRYEYSGYSEQLAWIDQSVYQVRKVEFHDRRGDLLKTLTLDDYREYDGGYWRAHRLAMVNHKTGKSTVLEYADYKFGIGLTDADFVRGRLSRLR